MPTQNTGTPMLMLASLMIAACDPTHGQPVVGGSMLHDEPDSAEPEAEDDDSSESDESTDGDPPLLDFGGTGDGDGDGEPLPEDPEPEPECLTHTDCDVLSTACSLGVCGPNGSCEAIAVNNGDPCDDLDACSIGSTCSAGECIGGQPLDCAELDDSCTVGECSPDTGTCVAVELDGCELAPEPEPEPEPEQPVCPIGATGCACTQGGGCDPGLVCDGGTCMTPAALCEGLITPTMDWPGTGSIVAVQVEGPMTDESILDTCEACGMTALCGSVENTAACADGYTESFNGPARRCCKPCGANCQECYVADVNWHDDSCTQLEPLTPDDAGETSHWLLARELGCSSPLDCEALLGTSWAYTAGNNQHWEPDGQGGYVWISDGPVGIELFTGWLYPHQCQFGNCPYSDDEPQYVDGYGHWLPNKTDYADRKTLCVEP